MSDNDGLTHVLTRYAERLPPDQRAHYEAALRRRKAGEVVLVGERVADECPRCHGAGYLRRDVPSDDPLFGEPLVCSCFEQELRRRQVARTIGASGLQDFGGVTFEATTPWKGLEAQWQQAREWSVAPRGVLWLMGPYYTSKTRLAMCIGNAWLAENRAVMFRVEPTMLDELRTTYNSDTANFGEQWDALCGVDCFILDDFGKAKSSDWVEEKRFSLLNHRIERLLPTVITTNLSLTNLKAEFARLAPRVLNPELATVIPFPSRKL